MLANSNKSHLNAKIVSILERASSKSSEKNTGSLLSQRFSQSNQPKPNPPTYSQGFSSQEHQNYPSSPFDSQKYTFGNPQFTQRTQPFPDQMKNSFNVYMQNNVPRHSYPGFMTETTQAIQHHSDYSMIESEGSMNFSNQRTQNLFTSSFQNSQRFSLPNKVLSQHEIEPLPQQSYSRAATMPVQDSSENSKQETQTQESSEENLMDDLGSHLINTLNGLKADLKKEISKCTSISEAQTIVLRKFNTFDAALRQILETYEQFETQLKHIEEVFLEQVGLVLNAFEENCQKIGMLQKNVTRRIDLNNVGLLRTFAKFDFEPVKKSITKEMLKVKVVNKEKKGKFVPRQGGPVNYERVMQTIPNYATAHQYYTRHSILLEGNGEQGMEIEEITTKKAVEDNRRVKAAVKVVKSGQGNNEVKKRWRN